MKRKINDGMKMSQRKANEALSTGVEALARLKAQGSKLSGTNDTLSPLFDSAERSQSISNVILSSMQSGKTMFYICAIVTIVIIFLVIRWKRS